MDYRLLANLVYTGFLGYTGLVGSLGILDLGIFLDLLHPPWPHEPHVEDLEKCLRGLAKLVIASYRLGEMPGGFGETGYIQL